MNRAPEPAGTFDFSLRLIQDFIDDLTEDRVWPDLNNDPAWRPGSPLSVVGAADGLSEAEREQARRRRIRRLYRDVIAEAEEHMEDLCSYVNMRIAEHKREIRLAAERTARERAERVATRNAAHSAEGVAPATTTSDPMQRTVSR